MGVLVNPVISPNMSLPIPTVGQESGPEYALDVNTALAILDSHNHSPGSGVQINPDGLDINSSLPFNDNFATSVAGITFFAQGSQPAINTVYENGLDLYFIDGAGNNVRLTQNGGVAGSAGSISGLTSPASASYVPLSKTFVWQSDVNTAANMDAGSVLLRNLSPNSTFALTLSPPSALTSNYTITLPSIPVTPSLLQIDSSGVISPASNHSVQQAQLALRTTGSTVAAGGVATDLIPSIIINTTSYVVLATVVITTTGRPVYIGLMGDPSGVSHLDVISNSGTMTLGLFNGSTAVSQTLLNPNTTGAISSSLFVLDFPAAGTYTYTLQAKVSGTTTATMVNTNLVAYEL